MARSRSVLQMRDSESTPLSVSSGILTPTGQIVLALAASGESRFSSLILDDVTAH